LQSVDIKAHNGHAEDLLSEFLGRPHTRLFLHELHAWLRSPYAKLEDWDRNVQYGQELPEAFDVEGRPLRGGKPRRYARSRSPEVERWRLGEEREQIRRYGVDWKGAGYVMHKNLNRMFAGVIIIYPRRRLRVCVVERERGQGKEAGEKRRKRRPGQKAERQNGEGRKEIRGDQGNLPVRRLPSYICKK
jgi:hypothetical protein